MDGIEEKLAAIFNSPESMDQIRRLAESLSGTENSSEKEKQNSEGMGIENYMLQNMMRIISASKEPNDTSRLIEAMKPWLDRERILRLEKALRIARLTTTAKKLLPDLSEKLR